MPSDDPPTVAPPGEETQTLPPAPPLPGAEALVRAGPVELPMRLGRYRLEQLLGRGGMGAVYRAHDDTLGRIVALKIPFLSGPSADAVRARFLREAQAAAALAHPNICPVFDLGDIDGVPYLTMPFIEGRPLAKLIDRARPLEPARAAALVRTVALALHEAHTRGVVHRDLKPGNVLIDGRGEPIVMDFGLARRADVLGLTRQGEMMGTPAYMPPEQVEGDNEAVGPASDVYSLGVVLYELLTGRTPFLGDWLSLVSQITADDPEAPSKHRPGLPDGMDRVCLRALARRPDRRWPSMRDFALALEPFTRPGGAALLLRVLGTPFAYRPAPGQAVVTLGRQKRRPGEPADVGNDVVLRVPGNDVMSARISRRHLEVCDHGGQLVAIDRSKAGTLHNGRPMSRGVPTPLVAGDRLVVAGVLTLEVTLEAGPVGRPLGGQEITLSHAGAAVAIEATLGDMVTMD